MKKETYRDTLTSTPEVKSSGPHNFGKHNTARKHLMAYHGISSRSAAKALRYINQFK